MFPTPFFSYVFSIFQLFARALRMRLPGYKTMAQAMASVLLWSTRMGHVELSVWPPEIDGTREHGVVDCGDSNRF